MLMHLHIHVSEIVEINVAFISSPNSILVSLHIFEVSLNYWVMTLNHMLAKGVILPVLLSLIVLPQTQCL